MIMPSICKSCESAIIYRSTKRNLEFRPILLPKQDEICAKNALTIMDELHELRLTRRVGNALSMKGGNIRLAFPTHDDEIHRRLYEE